ncbi:hypothetical protein BV20DRAFT_1058236 [Pilatotrama ljubarskyi]|nr:hypothetical protein BV20DRAFT_1058236 [Pilatotrama ljubarskyi]
MAEGLLELNRRFGDIVYLVAFSQPMALLGMHEVAVDLLEKRSAKYSNRPSSTMVHLTVWEWASPVTGYGSYAKWLIAFFFASSKNPENLAELVRYAFGVGIVRIAYGIDIHKGDTPYLAIALDTMATFGKIFVPGKYLSETLPEFALPPLMASGNAIQAPGRGLVSNRTMRLRDVPYRAVVAALVRPADIVMPGGQRTLTPDSLVRLNGPYVDPRRHA